MMYEDCLRSTFFDLESWGIVGVGLIIGLVLKRAGRVNAAIAISAAGALGALFWAYSYYEFNCVELFGL